MPASDTQFKKGNPGKPKGAIHKTTKAKLSFGIKNWSELQNFIENEGIEKYIKELKKLKGRSYAQAFNSITEFVKPKLQRTTVAGDKENPVAIEIHEIEHRA